MNVQDRKLGTTRPQSHVEQSIIDVDRHAGESLADLCPYVDLPWRRDIEIKVKQQLENYVLPMEVADELVAGRLKRPLPTGPGSPQALLESSRAIVTPSSLLGLGLHPQVPLEVALANAYARWVTDKYLPSHPNHSAYIYLPFNDPIACESIIEQYGHARGVAGFLLTSMRYQPFHDNRYLRVYAALQDCGLPVAFHTAPLWRERNFEMFDQYLPAYAIGLPLYHLIHLINIVVHGIPERFPKLRFIFLESGLSWLPFVLYRLDSEYEKRPSEAPLLKRKPSEYIREFYFTTQPLEQIPDEKLDVLFDMIGTQSMLFASNYPRWDFDLPIRVQRLPFLDNEQKNDIFFGNANRVFQCSVVR